MEKFYIYQHCWGLYGTLMNKCYFCQKPATSKEHVPPKCLFPEEKDLKLGEDYRKELITVPACDEHNSQKSRDDEYLLLILALGYFNNAVARNHFSKKLFRALSRRPALLVQLFGTQKPVTVDAEPTVSVDIDRDRFDASIEKVCRGLYYYENLELWPYSMQIYTPVLLSDESDEFNRLVTNLSKAAINKLSQIEKKGENPDVFWYQLQANKDTGKLVCRMMFYSGFDVFAVSNSVLR